MIDALEPGHDYEAKADGPLRRGPDLALPQRIAAALAEGQSLAAARELESELSYGRHAGPAPSTARPAAVLVLLYPAERGWCLPLTVRPRELSAHPGQISLPGGLVEPGETSQAAALRELGEELGVEPEEIVVLGRLAELYIFVSDFVVTPWVACAAGRPRFRPNAAEVAEVLELPLAWLVDPANLGTSIRAAGGFQFRSPYFALGGHQIWGATSMILAELRAIVRQLDAGVQAG